MEMALRLSIPNRCRRMSGQTDLRSIITATVENMHSLPPGKKIGQHTYYHVDVLPALDSSRQTQVKVALGIAGISPENCFNVIKLSQAAETVTLLNYPCLLYTSRCV